MSAPPPTNRPPTMSLFPEVALAPLDWSAVLVAAGMSYATALSLLGRVPFPVEGTVLTGAPSFSGARNCVRKKPASARSRR